MKCDGTIAETRFRLSAKWTSPFKSAGASVQSTTGSRGVRIGGSNAGYTMFRGSVEGTGYPLHSPVSPSLPPPPPVRHRVPSRFNWSLPSAVQFVPFFLRQVVSLPLDTSAQCIPAAENNNNKKKMQVRFEYAGWSASQSNHNCGKHKAVSALALTYK